MKEEMATDRVPGRMESERIPDTSGKERASCLSEAICGPKTANYKLP